jgi:cysteine-rich repeat protein
MMHPAAGFLPERSRIRLGAALAFVSMLAVAPPLGRAADVTGTVEFQGQVVFAAPIPGIAADDLSISAELATEATDPGEQCSILSVTADTPDPDGTYPGAGGGAVTAEILLHRGGPQVPDGECLVTLQALGSDGASVSARGSLLLFVNAADIGSNATIAVPDITVRESKAVASLASDCFAWVKKQYRKRRRCNLILLRDGAAGAARCSDAALEEPVGCDPGNHVEAMLALSHGDNDQQTAPGLAEGVDFAALRLQIACQRRFGAAARGFAFMRMRRVRTECVDNNADSTACRDAQSQASKRPLDRIDGCTVDQLIDIGTGRPVPDVGPPCDVCIDGAGVIDRKCLKGCYQLVLDELTDGIIGDIAVCGNGIEQPGETCDDGNTTAGDCCSATCTAETPGTEGPMGDATCTDAIDNDCDGSTDAADTDCQ